MTKTLVYDHRDLPAIVSRTLDRQRAVTRIVTEQAAQLPHNEPHDRLRCLRCTARAALGWTDIMPLDRPSDNCAHIGNQVRYGDQTFCNDCQRFI